VRWMLRALAPTTAVALITAAVFGSITAKPSLVHAQQCGDPPRVDDQSLKGDLEGKAKFLSGLVGDAGLKGQVEAAKTDIFSKYPDAAKAHSDTYLEYMFCTFVLSDPKLSAQEKFRAIQEFRQANTSGSITTKGPQSPVVQGTQGNVQMNFGMPLAKPPPP
jgi:hypothetical protein